MLTKDHSALLPAVPAGTVLKMKAFALYAAILCAIAFPVCAWVAGPLGEHVARNWLLMLAVLLGPLTSLRLPWWQTLFISMPIGLAVLSAQAYLAYEYNQYQPTAPVSMGWLTASIAFYMLAAALSAWIVRRLIWQEFKAFNA